MKRIKKIIRFFNLFSIVGTWESINLNFYGYHLSERQKSTFFSIIYVVGNNPK